MGAIAHQMTVGALASNGCVKLRRIRERLRAGGGGVIIRAQAHAPTEAEKLPAFFKVSRERWTCRTWPTRKRSKYSGLLHAGFRSEPDSYLNLEE